MLMTIYKIYIGTFIFFNWLQNNIKLNKKLKYDFL